MLRRLIEGSMPFDKAFSVNGNEMLCHCTGYEVNWDDPDNPSDWWNEYCDINGNVHYGR